MTLGGDASFRKVIPVNELGIVINSSETMTSGDAIVRIGDGTNTISLFNVDPPLSAFGVPVRVIGGLGDVGANVNVSNFPATYPATQSGSWTVDVGNFPATQQVSGTVTANTGLSQPLTDAQLRASAVPVSGTVTANTGLSQPLTDTQLRATPVPISGSTTVPGVSTAANQSTQITNFGAIADAAASSDIGNFSFLSFVKRLLSVTLAKGQQLMAASLPVAVASNQSKYPVWIANQPVKRTPETRRDVPTSSGLYLPAIVCRLKSGGTRLIYPESASVATRGREHEFAVFIDDNTVLGTTGFSSPTNVTAASTDIETRLNITGTYTPSGNARCIFRGTMYRETTASFNLAQIVRVNENALIAGKHLIFAILPIGGNGNLIGMSVNLIEV